MKFFSEILQSCKNNKPLVEALNLDEILEKEFDFPTHFESFQRQINESLKEFDFSNESITVIESFSSQIQQYESNLTELSTKFKQVKQVLDEQTNYENEINETEKILEKLEKSMENVSSTLEILPEKLQKLLNFKSKFQDFILDFPQKIKDGIKDLITNLTKGSINCDSILEIRQSVEDLICGNILDGINGSWSGLGLVLIIVIPIMILSNYLDSAMRKSSETDDNDFTDFMANPSQHIYMNGNFYFLNFAQLNFVCFRIEPKCPKPKQFAIQSNNIKYLGLKMTFQFDLS